MRKFYCLAYGTVWTYQVGRKTFDITDPEGHKYYPLKKDVLKDETMDEGTSVQDYITNVILKERFEKEGLPTCHYCKEKKPDVVLQVSPYAVIDGNETPQLSCNDCRNTQAEEV